MSEYEKLDSKWIDENKVARINNLRKMTMDDVVPVENLQNLLVPKQEEITEEQAWEVLSELYAIPSKSYIREAMRVVADYVGNDMTIGELKEKFAKPAIPQFVAKHIKKWKDSNVSLSFAMTTLQDELTLFRGDDEKVKLWLYDSIEGSENQEIYARAWLDGYRVKEEPKYRVEDSHGRTILAKMKYSHKGKTFEKVEPYNGLIVGYKKELTEKEIKDYDPKYWAFRKPLEELEE